MSAAPLHEDSALAGDVLALADERLALMPLVAAAKWPAHQPVTDPAREAAVISAAGVKAEAMGLARAPVEEFFRVQIRRARAVQEQLTARWNRDGYDYVEPYPDLTKDLRPRLDALTERMIVALYLAAPALTRPTAPVQLAARSGTALPAVRWDEPARAALIASLSAIRLDGRGSLARARAAGVVRIGTPADYAPFSVEAGGALSGSDVELASGLAEHLGLRPVFIRTTWRTLIDDLTADRVDLVVGGVSATPARLEAAEASVALSRSGKSAIGRCADRERFPTLAAIDASAVTVVENPGGTNESFARSHLKSAAIVIHADNRTVFDEIIARHADVMFTDETEIALATYRHGELCRLLPGAFDIADKVFLYRRGGGWASETDLWLRTQIAQGVPGRLLDTYTRTQ